MNRFTKVKMIIVSFMLVVLAACANNNATDNVTNDDRTQSAGIKRVNDGYVTDDHEPFRTTLSSDKYPHTTSIQNADGQRKYFNFIEKRIVVGPGQNVDWNRGNFQTAPTPRNNVTPGQNRTTTPPATGDQTNQQPAKNVTPAPTQNEGTTGISQFEQQVINLTNQQRQKNGLPALKADTSLSKVARTKSNDMRKNNYFSHTSPTYGSPFDMMRDFGVTYRTAGENIAKGQQSPEAVVNAWMNSEGHRKNILNANFTHIGVGHDANGNYWTQMFVGR